MVLEDGLLLLRELKGGGSGFCRVASHQYRRKSREIYGFGALFYKHSVIYVSHKEKV